MKLTGARDVPGKYGPQVAGQTTFEGQRRVVYLSAKTGIVKGLKSGKLKMPLRLVSTTSYVEPTKDRPNGSIRVWALAPKE